LAAAQAAPYVILQNDRRMDGVEIRAKADGTVVLISAGGQQMEFTRGQYKQAVADRPPEMEQAQRAMQAQQYDAAIPLLRKVMDNLRFLGWDEKAGELLVDALAAKEDYKGALDVYEQMIRQRPDVLKDANFGWGYRRALLGAGQAARLEPMLKQLIESGSREDAARAQLMRGDIRAAQGQLEAAALDYLRTAYFFEAEKAVRPEALLKVAATLEKMRDARAKEWYQRLKMEFPGSPEAAAAAGKG